jgi:5-methylcytosine-specific restriction endonuclease McrA
MKEKKCIGICNRVLPLENFPIHKEMTDGYVNKCRECTAIYNMAYHKQNKEKHNASAKAWRIENKEQDRDLHSAWRANNPERVREIRRRADEKYRKTKKYQDKIERRRKRESSTKTGVVSLNSALERDGMNCGICHKIIEQNSQLVFDHIIPLARDGKHIENNLQPAHRSCNSWKCDRLPEELIGLAIPLPDQDDEWQVRRHEKANQQRSETMKKVWQEKDFTERNDKLSEVMKGNTNGRFTKGIKKGPMSAEQKQKLSATNKFRILKPEIDNNKIAELYKTELSFNKIGKQLKIDKTTVKKRLMMIGLVE